MRPALVAALLLAASDSSSLSLPPAVARVLEGGAWEGTPAGFRVIALSHVGDGCVGQATAHPERGREARACVEAALERARSLESRDGLYLSHLGLLYGAADRLGPCVDAGAHERLVRELARRSLADPLKHAASYERVRARWPADQAVTLAAIARFDAAHGTALVRAPLEAWRGVMAQHVDARTGLPWSEVAGVMGGAQLPRGCAQSWLSRYVAEYDPALARAWWQQYREHFEVRLGGIVGFREWPAGVERRADLDSGPIVWGIGTAASAFAVSAAKAQGDLALAAQLEASASAVRALGVGGDAAEGLLPQAIMFEGRWHRAGVPPE